ncbi:MAG: N5-carboxyaminoimidazole ribonucleotide synthase [Candidatus Saccharibacteria bacterium]|nr:N5-carboxyaminoimidazole ribonucleotide synthase [Candidatus Saccharibacteria bacterium]
MHGSQTIGIIGGGQLGRMLTLAALPLGFKVIVVDPGEDSPAAQVGAKQIVADLYDRTALKQLAEKSDWLTIEIEHLDADILDELVALGKPVNPAPSTIRLIQDKYLQKKFFEEAGIPVAPFVEIPDERAANDALKAFEGKMLIKTRHGAYDGRGNMVVEDAAQIKKAFKLFAGKQLYAEKLIPFSKELAVMVARTVDGDVAAYPVVETIHERNICVEVLAPAPISKTQTTEATNVALQAVSMLHGAGMFGVELFLTKEGDILINEIAPRVHNSGHHTIEANHTSQFEQHVRAITGLPLGDTTLSVPAAVMINILGERNDMTKIKGLDKALANPRTSVHLYGKSPTKVDRKMGHITATGKTVKEARARARKARKQLSI